MSNLSQRFNNLSLYKKILLILSTTLLFVFFAFVVGIQLLSQYYARELYTSNAQSLNYVSSFVSARMETVESGSARLVILLIIRLGNRFSHLRISLDILHFVVVHNAQITATECFCHGTRYFRFSLDHSCPHLLGKRLHFMLGGNSHSTTFFCFRLGDL